MVCIDLCMLGKYWEISGGHLKIRFVHGNTELHYKGHNTISEQSMSTKGIVPSWMGRTVCLHFEVGFIVFITTGSAGGYLCGLNYKTNEYELCPSSTVK